MALKCVNADSAQGRRPTAAAQLLIQDYPLFTGTRFTVRDPLGGGEARCSHPGSFSALGSVCVSSPTSVMAEPAAATQTLTSAMAESAAAGARPSLEDLAFRFGTDKAHDDHKYTDLYAHI